ncbi:MAG: flgG [Thermoleophilia bacterium]|nr:flgG [Thermoleophilia bacterium]
MLRAMYTSITGLRNHQTMLDVVGNNIANVNTNGFKASSASFKTLLSQTTQGAGAPSATLGGTNNIQVGLGMTLDSISQKFTQGALQGTGVMTDLAIQGDGFFQVAAGSPANIALGTVPINYTRAGNFAFDSTGTLVSQDGNFVLGWSDTDLTNSQLSNPADPLSAPIPLFDLDITDNTGVIQLPPNLYSDIIIGTDGRVTGIYNDTSLPADPRNGTRETVAQLALSRFANPGGLTQIGNNRWSESLNSGAPVSDVAQNNGLGSLFAGNLEMSNVDLATEFTEMIKAQRGFQANSRTITTADEILQELVNLKR